MESPTTFVSSDVSQAKDITNQDSSRSRYSTFLNFVKGTTVHTCSMAVLSLGQNINVLANAIIYPGQQKADKQLLRDIISTIIERTDEPSQLIKYINPNDILASACPKATFLKQARQIKVFLDYSVVSPFDFIAPVIRGPVIEELVYRGLIQDVLLKRLPMKVMKYVAPSYMKVLDSKIYTTCRIIFTSLLFSVGHINNPLPKEQLSVLMIGSFVGGISFGIIKERFGLSGSIGAHAMHNLISSLQQGLLSAC